MGERGADSCSITMEEEGAPVGQIVMRMLRGISPEASVSRIPSLQWFDTCPPLLAVNPLHLLLSFTDTHYRRDGVHIVVGSLWRKKGYRWV